MSWLLNKLFRKPRPSPEREYTVSIPARTKQSVCTRLSFDVPCVLRPPSHKLQIIIVNKIVKAIVSPCSRDEALASSALSENGCGAPLTGVIDRLRGSTQWGRFSDTDDKLLNEAYKHAAAVKSEREAARLQHDETFRVPPSIWALFIKQQTGLVAAVEAVNERGRARAELRVETQLASSLYRFDGGTWGLAGGPGDRRIGELLDKYIKLNGLLAAVGARWEPSAYFNGCNSMATSHRRS